MTESEWLKTTDAYAMLNMPLIYEGGLLPISGEPVKVSNRKLSLFAAAIHRMTDPKDIEFIIDWEKEADEEPSRCSLQYANGQVGQKQGKIRKGVAANMLRDIAGNPFQETLLDPECRTHDVMRLAEQAYEKHIPDDSGELDNLVLSLLGDALQDGGCKDDMILDHLYKPHARHYRGCWVVDLILGKE